MKDFKSVDESNPVICTRTRRLMRVKEIARSFTMKDGSVVVYKKPRLLCELSNPPKHLKGEEFDLGTFWEFSAIYHKAGSTGDGLCFNESVI